MLPGSIQADNGAVLTQGIIGLVKKGQPRKLADCGALRAWAWGPLPLQAVAMLLKDHSIFFRSSRH